MRGGERRAGAFRSQRPPCPASMPNRRRACRGASCASPPPGDGPARKSGGDGNGGAGSSRGGARGRWKRPAPNPGAVCQALAKTPRICQALAKRKTAICQPLAKTAAICRTLAKRKTMVCQRSAIRGIFANGWQREEARPVRAATARALPPRAPLVLRRRREGAAYPAQAPSGGVPGGMRKGATKQGGDARAPEGATPNFSLVDAGKGAPRGKVCRVCGALGSPPESAPANCAANGRGGCRGVRGTAGGKPRRTTLPATAESSPPSGGSGAATRHSRGAKGQRGTRAGRRRAPEKKFEGLCASVRRTSRAQNFRFLRSASRAAGGRDRKAGGAGGVGPPARCGRPGQPATPAAQAPSRPAGIAAGGTGGGGHAPREGRPALRNGRRGPGARWERTRPSATPASRAAPPAPSKYPARPARGAVKPLETRDRTGGFRGLLRGASPPDGGRDAPVLESAARVNVGGKQGFPLDARPAHPVSLPPFSPPGGSLAEVRGRETTQLNLCPSWRAASALRLPSNRVGEGFSLE